jgi:ABC-type transporter Mla MlaB component
LPAAKPSPIVFAVDGPITRADIPRLCAALLTLLAAGDVETVDCEVGARVRPDAVTVDALARLQLTARRLGCRLRLRHASSELRELIAFMGLRTPMSSGSARGLRT